LPSRKRSIYPSLTRYHKSGLVPPGRNKFELVRLNDEDFPFCSDRCRKIDLGKWASGVYRISSPVLDPEVLEDLGGLAGGQSKDSDKNE
jgi:endogenous inhibitor of DNA gyrase (YacG/DUF329 family)